LRTFVRKMFTKCLLKMSTTIKSVIKSKDTNKEGKVNVKIRITHKRKIKYLPTIFYVFPNEFDNEKGLLRKKSPNAAFINLELQKKVFEFQKKVIEFPANITPEALFTHLAYSNENKEDIDFFILLKNKINHLKEIGKLGSSRINESTSKILSLFVKKPILDFKAIDFNFLKSFENFMQLEGLKTNSIGVHMRNVRAIYNQAIDEQIISLEYYPFRRFKIKKERTIKRSLAIDQLKKIKNTVFKDANLEFAKDYFFLSFYLIGINVIDMYNLIKIKNGRIIYRRSKTGRIYDVKVQPEALALIEKYKGIERLLNFYEKYNDHRNLDKSVNKKLKRIATLCEIDDPISTYYARHSWATVASKIGISKDIISHALGHGNDTVTDVYIDFDLSKVDAANKAVIEALK